MKVQDILSHVGEHHVKCAKAHQAAMDGEDEGTSRHDFHKSMMAEHTAMAETCLSALKTVKAAGAGDDDALVPTLVSAVTPNHPDIRAVPRFGMRPIPTPDVDAEFGKIFGIGTEEQE
jgi:hypothetical protein